MDDRLKTTNATNATNTKTISKDDQPKDDRPKNDQPKDAILYGLGAASIAIVLVWFLTFWWT